MTPSNEPPPAFRHPENADECSILDALRAHYPQAERQALLALIRGRKVRIDGAFAGPRARVLPGQQVTVESPPAPGRRATRAALAFIHQERSFIALDKAAGLPVHEAKDRDDALTQRVRAWLRAEGRSPQISIAPANRLDAPTSGIVLFGLDARTQRALGATFHDARAAKLYLAIVEGKAPAPQEIDAEVEGRRAHSSVLSAEHGSGASLVAIRPRTGRRHQIRRHLAELGHAVAGDRRYRSNIALKDRARILLHAAALQIPHPRSGEPLFLWAPPPEDFESFAAERGLSRYLPAAAKEALTASEPASAEPSPA